MKLWPFRSLLLRSGAASNSKYAMPCRHLHHFGDFAGLREALHLTNLLTGWVQGRVGAVEAGRVQTGGWGILYFGVLQHVEEPAGLNWR